MGRSCYLFSTGQTHHCSVVESGDGWVRVDVEDRGIHIIAPSQLQACLDPNRPARHDGATENA